MITNLLDTYDRLIAFGKKHLNDLFVIQGLQSISTRDNILREIVSNLLIHRDYANVYVAKFVIEKNRLFTENSNRPHGSGKQNASYFDHEMGCRFNQRPISFINLIYYPNNSYHTSFVF